MIGKSSLFAIASLLLGVSGVFAADNAKSLVIMKTDNSSIRVNLSEKLTTTFDNGSISIKDDDTDIVIPINEVARWTYTNIKFSGIDDINGNSGNVEYRNGEISITNLPHNSNVVLYSTSGAIVKSMTGEDDVTISLADLPHGVYVLSINNSTLKIAK